MTNYQGSSPEPAHPIGQLTTRELSDYRRRLERAIGDRTVGQAPIAADLREKLSEVISEEAERERHRRSGQRWPLNNLCCRPRKSADPGQSIAALTQPDLIIAAGDILQPAEQPTTNHGTPQ